MAQEGRRPGSSRRATEFHPGFKLRELLFLPVLVDIGQLDTTLDFADEDQASLAKHALPLSDCAVPPEGTKQLAKWCSILNELANRQDRTDDDAEHSSNNAKQS